MDPENVVPLAFGGQVYEEDLVEPAFAQQLRRQRLYLIGGGDYENRDRLLLEPREKGAEDAGCGPSVGRAGALRAGEALLQLVEPEDAGSDRFGDADRLSHILLG